MFFLKDIESKNHQPALKLVGRWANDLPSVLKNESQNQITFVSCEPVPCADFSWNKKNIQPAALCLR